MAKKVTLDWTDPSPTTYVNQLEIWRKLDGGTYAHIGGAQLGDETYDDESGVVELSKYYYEVRAYNIDRNYSVVENNITISSSYLLDNYTGALAAYSLRKLKTGITYAIEIRRDNDNATTGVQVYTNGDNIDLSSIVSDGGVSLSTWVGSNSAYIKTWYDQSGNGLDALQITGANQPRIISTGTLDVENGESALEFDGSNDSLLVFNNTTAPAAIQSMSDNISSFYVHRNDARSAAGSIYYPGHTILEVRQNIATTRNVPISYGISSSNMSHGTADTTGTDKVSGATTVGLSTQYLSSSFVVGDNIDLYLNASSDVSSSTTATSDRSLGGSINSSFTLGVRTRDGGQADNAYFTGAIQEIILYDEDKTSDRAAIETEINNHYSIY